MVFNVVCDALFGTLSSTAFFVTRYLDVFGVWCLVYYVVVRCISILHGDNKWCVV